MNFFNNVLNPIELPLLNGMHGSLECGFLDFIMPLISAFSKYGIFWIALAVILLCFRKSRRTGVTMLLSLALGLVICNFILKPWTARIRPYVDDPTIKLLIEAETGYSFPSGHTIAGFEGAFSIFLNNKKWGVPALILAVLIGFSRLYLQMHYFTDVIAAVILGIALALAAYYLGGIILKKTGLPC